MLCEGTVTLIFDFGKPKLYSLSRNVIGHHKNATDEQIQEHPTTALIDMKA